AGYALLSELHQNHQIYTELEQKTAYLEKKLHEVLSSTSMDYSINRVGSMISIFFSSEPATGYDSAIKTDVDRFKSYFHAMLDAGIYLPPAAYEAWFISNAHSYADLDKTIEATRTWAMNQS